MVLRMPIEKNSKVLTKNDATHRSARSYTGRTVSSSVTLLVLLLAGTLP